MRTTVTVAILLGFVVAMTGPGIRDIEASPGWRSGDSAEVVLEWNQLLQATIPSTRFAGRAALLFDDAHRDVRCSEQRRAGVQQVSCRCCGTASARLPTWPRRRPLMTCSTALLPANATVYDAALAARLGKSPSRSRSSVLVGSRVAKEILAWRQNDGWAAPPPAYVLPPFPGLWQPAPGAAELHAISECHAICASHRNAISAAATSNVDQRTICPGLR